MVYSITDPCDKSESFYYHNRIVIICSDVLANTNTIYAFVDYNNGEMHLLDTKSFVAPTTRLIQTSEQLTKIYVQDSSACQFFSIDFDYGQISEVTL